MRTVCRKIIDVLVDDVVSDVDGADFGGLDIIPSVFCKINQHGRLLCEEFVAGAPGIVVFWVLTGMGFAVVDNILQHVLFPSIHKIGMKNLFVARKLLLTKR